MNGFTAMADRHARFYPGIQYTEEGEGLYAKDKVGRFPMNAFADQVPGGPIDWEIDNTGFGLWLYRLHAGSLSKEDPAAAEDFLRDVAASTRLAADLLTECKDESNDLQCVANEDDNLEFTQTIHGAITTWLGLKSAAEIFEALDRPERARVYRARVAELDRAIRAEFAPASHPWSYWPARFWDEDDTENNDYARDHRIEKLQSLYDLDSRGSQYSQKTVMALQMPPLRNAKTLNEAAAAHDFYLNTMVRQDTLHMGEFTNYNDVDADGETEFVNVVATTNLWAQTLVYLSLVAQDHPERLEVPAIAPLPGVGQEDEGGCNAAGSPGAAGAGLLLALVFGLGIGRRAPRVASRQS
jgi:hypothetical protein